jgi:hypothetical protein
LALPAGFRLVTWTMPAVINRNVFLPQGCLLPGVRLVAWIMLAVIN